MPRADPVVLDTHIWLDVAIGRGRFLPRVVRRLDAAADAGTLYVAAITVWEVAMLARAGKLRIGEPLIAWLDGALSATRTAIAALDPAIAVDAVELPWDHGDPADRLIVATARHRNAVLVTRDGSILEYAVESKAVRTLEPA
jgi:PIN domain nuclease of toxin-antitoxin system